MASRKRVTARQERLGRELRKLRETRRLSLREAARRTGIDEGRLSNTESGRVGVSSERVRYLAGRYACDDEALVGALAGMAEERGRDWWSGYRDHLPASFVDLAEMEHNSTGLLTFESVHVPGLLQTEAHVRAIYSGSVPALPAEQMQCRIAFRLARQKVLSRESPVSFDAVIHEAALRVRVADRKVAREQLLHILEQSDRDNVSIRVVPFGVDGFTLIGNPLLYVRGPVERLDTVLLDSARGGAFVDDEAILKRYRVLLRKVQQAALGQTDSRDLILRLAQET